MYFPLLDKSTENFMREISNIITIFNKINQVYHGNHKKSF